MFTCPCCGFQVFEEQPGSYDICPICFWEDDPIQLASPDSPGGANKLSLIDAQKNYQKIGASEERFIGNVRRPTAIDQRDPSWHPFDLIHDKKYEGKFQADMSVLYYWR